MWRRYSVRQARPRRGGLALDVATGTGRIAQELARRGARAVGIDFVPEMMLQGRRDGVGSAQPVYFAGADALELLFAGDTFDCVTTGFAMRNVIDMEYAASLIPQSKLVVMEGSGHLPAMTRRRC